jgi:hypothetical protein
MFFATELNKYFLIIEYWCSDIYNDKLVNLVPSSENPNGFQRLYQY